MAAYAAAGIAGANPFRAGNTAFKLGNAKALVPIVFVYAPSLLIVTQGFSRSEFVIALSGCILGILILGAALTGYLAANLRRWQRWLLGIGSLFLFAPGIQFGIVGIVVCAPVLAIRPRLWRERRAGSGAVPIPQEADSSE